MGTSTAGFFSSTATIRLSCLAYEKQTVFIQRKIIINLLKRITFQAKLWLSQFDSMTNIEFISKPNIQTFNTKYQFFVVCHI